ncbi:hypothetical protein RM844_22825 [Streptomyces sp. DSM 44915]|uniref:Uncharacterized protein n=1 Tax=Streptomyces chisholmiae TaxID=3075540 RepID=A0ABU2JVV8_9ACTN|nr:hypothetical protein [Streptomyces sp. DSM 44915]MDT0269125.1 hypothetical protein [Streptomyces sp. DSM 44915]
MQQARDAVRQGSPSWRKLEPPEVPTGSYTVPIGLIGIGALAVGQGPGGVALGTLLIAAGIVLATAIRNRVEAAEARLAEWSASRWCVACDTRRPPDWQRPTEAA